MILRVLRMLAILVAGELAIVLVVAAATLVALA